MSRLIPDLGKCCQWYEKPKNKYHDIEVTYRSKTLIVFNLLTKRGGEFLDEMSLRVNNNEFFREYVADDQAEMVRICKGAGSGAEQMGELLYAAGFRKVVMG